MPLPRRHFIKEHGTVLIGRRASGAVVTQDQQREDQSEQHRRVTDDARQRDLIVDGVVDDVSGEYERECAQHRRHTGRRGGTDTGDHHGHPKGHHPGGGFIHEVRAGHRSVVMRGHHPEVDSGDLHAGHAQLEQPDEHQRTPVDVVTGPVRVAGGAGEGFDGRGSEDLSGQVVGRGRTRVGELTVQPPRPPQPFPAGRAGEHMLIQTLACDARLLTVDPRRQLLAHFLTVHPSIVAYRVTLGVKTP